jgi:hypothetical protein
MTTRARPEYRPRIADYLLTLGLDAADQPGCLCWWAILGLNQWPLPCQGSALPLS